MTRSASRRGARSLPAGSLQVVAPLRSYRVSVMSARAAPHSHRHGYAECPSPVPRSEHRATSRVDAVRGSCRKFFRRGGRRPSEPTAATSRREFAEARQVPIHDSRSRSPCCGPARPRRGLPGSSRPPDIPGTMDGFERVTERRGRPSVLNQKFRCTCPARIPAGCVAPPPSIAADTRRRRVLPAGIRSRAGASELLIQDTRGTAGIPRAAVSRVSGRAARAHAENTRVSTRPNVGAGPALPTHSRHPIGLHGDEGARRAPEGRLPARLTRPIATFYCVAFCTSCSHRTTTTKETTTRATVSCR